MKEGITNLDTIKLMVDGTSQEEQQEVLRGVLHALSSTVPFTYIQWKPIGITTINRTHFVLYKGKKIAAITTGIFFTGSMKRNDHRKVYYVAVSFYGLKRYHESDVGSFQCLLALCIYLNTHYDYRITELDICLDVECPFDNVLTLLNKRAPNVRYFPPDTVQGDGKIRRIEDVPTLYYSKARVRAYTYDKAARNDWIKHDMTRFELKLNSIFFKGLEKPMPAIKKAVDKYTIMYFDNLKKRDAVLKQYKAQWLNNKLDVKKLGAEKYILAIDIDYVSEFIEMLFTIDADVSYKYLMPTRDKEALASEKNKNLQHDI